MPKRNLSIRKNSRSNKNKNKIPKKSKKQIIKKGVKGKDKKVVKVTKKRVKNKKKTQKGGSSTAGTAGKTPTTRIKLTEKQLKNIRRPQRQLSENEVSIASIASNAFSMASTNPQYKIGPPSQHTKRRLTKSLLEEWRRKSEKKNFRPHKGQRVTTRRTKGKAHSIPASLASGFGSSLPVEYVNSITSGSTGSTVQPYTFSIPSSATSGSTWIPPETYFIEGSLIERRFDDMFFGAYFLQSSEEIPINFDMNIYLSETIIKRTLEPVGLTSLRTNLVARYNTIDNTNKNSSGGMITLLNICSETEGFNVMWGTYFLTAAQDGIYSEKVGDSIFGGRRKTYSITEIVDVIGHIPSNSNIDASTVHQGGAQPTMVPAAVLRLHRLLTYFDRSGENLCWISIRKGRHIGTVEHILPFFAMWVLGLSANGRMLATFIEWLEDKLNPGRGAMTKEQTQAYNQAINLYKSLVSNMHYAASQKPNTKKSDLPIIDVYIQPAGDKGQVIFSWHPNYYNPEAAASGNVAADDALRDRVHGNGNWWEGGNNGENWQISGGTFTETAPMPPNNEPVLSPQQHRWNLRDIIVETCIRTANQCVSNEHVNDFIITWYSYHGTFTEDFSSPAVMRITEDVRSTIDDAMTN